MAVLTSTIVSAAAIGSAVVGVASYVEGQKARGAAAESQKRAQAEGEKMQGESRARNAADAARERRAQLREERVRRARILQSAENTGVDASSGEFGAIGSLSTNLASNIGDNLGRLGSAQRTSEYAQNAANFQGDVAQSMFKAQKMDGLFSLSSSIFSAAGGFGTLETALNSPGGSSDPFKSDARPRGGS
jgi:hypothetical protein